mgnify:CR=1 FL=1
MALSTFDGFISRVAAGYWASESCLSERNPAVSATLFSGQLGTMHLGQNFRAFPALPPGVTAYIPTRLIAVSSTTDVGLLWARLINLGELDIGPPTFTDGSAFPTITEAGVSRSASGPILAEVTTVLNATPGNITVTYVDQDGNAAEATVSLALTASALVGTCGFVSLNAGDYAVRDITTATRTGGTTPTGVIKFWGVRPLMLASNAGGASDLVIENLLTSAFCPQRLDAADAINVITIASAAIKTEHLEMFIVGDN